MMCKADDGTLSKPSSFDFIAFVYEKLVRDEPDTHLTRREYYRRCGLLFRLKRSESREILGEIKIRFPEFEVS
jgi:hypothetical protein